MDDCCSHRGKILSYRDVTAEPRIGLIRRRQGRYVFYFVFRVVDVARWCDVGVGGACVAPKEARFEVLEMNADALRVSRWWLEK